MNVIGLGVDLAEIDRVRHLLQKYGERFKDRCFTDHEWAYAHRYPDPSARDPKSDYYDPKATDDDPRWYMVDVEFVEKFPEVVPLERLKETKGLEEMVVTQRSRLSVQPVRPKEFEIVAKLGRGK